MTNKRRFLSAFICFVMLFTVSSCAETPKQDIVVNKGESNLEEIINSSQGSGVDTKSGDRVTESFKSASGEITFNIDAVLDVPEVDTIPVLKATLHHFTEDELKIYSDALFGENEVYEYYGEFSKEYYEKQILNVERLMGDRDAIADYYGESNVDEMQNETLPNMLAELKEHYDKAEDHVPVPSDYKYHPDEYYKDWLEPTEGLLSFKASSTVNDVPLYLQVSKTNDTGYVSSRMYAYAYDPNDIKHEHAYNQTTPFTDEEKAAAEELVLDFFEKTGLNCIITGSEVFEDNQYGTYGMNFDCAFEYGGVELCYPQHWTFLTDAGKCFPSEDVYAKTFLNSYIQVTVSNGIIIGLIIESPLDTEIINDNVRLLPREEIIENIKTQLEVMWSRGRFEAMCSDIGINAVTSSSEFSAAINVIDIEFRLIRTRVRDDPNSYYIIPAWIVNGTYEVIDAAIFDELTAMPLLAINALDGSAINITQGY